MTKRERFEKRVTDNGGWRAKRDLKTRKKGRDLALKYGFAVPPTRR